ncbi:MAG TPA: hypothetical protein VLC95_07205 [Anaerolineae bacterium]|nr:hypothetical protein [Anaerolineae bacterium]
MPDPRADPPRCLCPTGTITNRIGHDEPLVSRTPAQVHRGALPPPVIARGR